MRLTRRFGDRVGRANAEGEFGLWECEVIHKLAAYEDAEEAGLLVQLPCKIGTPCFKIWQFGCARKVIDWTFDYEDISEYGVTVFRSREEAKAAIEEE